MEEEKRKIVLILKNTRDNLVDDNVKRMSNFSRDDIRSPCLVSIYHRSSIVQNLIRDYEILPLEIECTGCLFSCATTPLSEFFSSSPISRFRSQFSADLFARHAYSSLKLFALSTFSPCTLIHRFAFRNGFARETSPPMNARTLVALTDSFILVYCARDFFFFYFTRFKLRDDYYIF